MSKLLHRISVRTALKPRREPYWGAPLERGRYVGYRVIAPGRGSWIARARTEGGQRYRALGPDTEAFGYDAACSAARAWFAEIDGGIVRVDRYTVADACRDYVEDRRREKGEACAADAEWRFRRYLAGAPLADVELRRLRSTAIKRWRDGLDVTPAGANRIMTTFRAALNLAVRNRYVPFATAEEWRVVRQFRNADRRRELFLDRGQRQALLDAANGSVRNLIEAGALTGARPGELARAPRSAFDGRTGTLTLTGKTGRRSVPMSPEARAFFERIVRNKLPGAPLLARPDGTPWRGTEWTPLVRAAASAAGLPIGVSLYTLRHSWISEALSAGLSPLEVARMTGTSLAMIDKHYGHLVKSASAERLAKVQIL